ncbi:tRNA glutamyl-Q(34) synthetase GluQRS [Cyanobium sp. ATX 6F1]|uniref:tRNA glutamyl-Q(34) synthetase GluQRS n=1 Tax=unclassified Cyanobium TaxID=2627006 RepID=UPI00396569E0
MALPAHLVPLLRPAPGRNPAEVAGPAPYRGRFAPSPTGELHWGNLRTALLSWLDARLHRGEWLLRFDDLDRPRNRVGAEDAILRDLDWLGLHWDGPLLRQSERRGLYGSVLSALRRSGELYPCRCSRRMLADPSAPHGEAPVYPGTCRGRPNRWGIEAGRLPSWRLRLPDAPIQWRERLAAPGILQAARQVGDPVLRRADGVLAYHLTTAVDELALGITTVVRGEDLWASTAPQVAVIEALGGVAPSYAHVPLWRQPSGERLAKRQGAEGLAAWRSEGLGAPEVIGRLAGSLGLVARPSALSARALLEQLSLEAFERALSLNKGFGIKGALGSETGFNS